MKDRDINLLKFSVILFLFLNSKNILLLLNKIIKVNGIIEISLSFIISLVAYLLYKKDLKKELIKFKKKKKEYIKLTFKLFSVLLAVKFITAVIIVILSEILNISLVISENQEIINDILKVNPFYIFIAAVIIAPFLEEVIFRLGVRKVIKNNYLFIIISGLIFGLLHVFPTTVGLTKALIDGINYVTIGLLFSYFYVKHKNIYIIILLHGVNNLFGVLASLFVL